MFVFGRLVVHVVDLASIIIPPPIKSADRLSLAALDGAALKRALKSHLRGRREAFERHAACTQLRQHLQRVSDVYSEAVQHPEPQFWATAPGTVTYGIWKWRTVYTNYAGSAAPTAYKLPLPVKHIIKTDAGDLNIISSNISVAHGAGRVCEPVQALRLILYNGQVGFNP
ncbi:hypothetical protein FB451DRAFT_1461934 [Mycena latifolia]|nr:hypothetical protein FB451DRAFT_1461934 [Mycena latifolia]